MRTRRLKEWEAVELLLQQKHQDPPFVVGNQHRHRVCKNEHQVLGLWSHGTAVPIDNNGI